MLYYCRYEVKEKYKSCVGSTIVLGAAVWVRTRAFLAQLWTLSHMAVTFQC